MTSTGQIVFRLKAYFRFDDDAKVFVGYVPALRVYTQSRTKENLPRAMTSAAKLFIHSCATRGILERVMQERGGKRVPPEAVPGIQKNEDAEFISIAGYPGYARMEEDIEILVQQLVPLARAAAVV